MAIRKVISFGDVEHLQVKNFRYNMYCRAVINFQASVEPALYTIGKCLSMSMQAHTISYRMDMTPEAVWPYFKLNSHAMANANLYLQRCERSFVNHRNGHLAIHCRRNDMKVILRKHIDEDGLQTLDHEMWGIIWAKKHDHIVHFITDSKEYLVYAWQKFGDSICYGLHWQHIQDTQERMGRRATSLADALENFAILTLCPTVWLCASSSLYEWLQQQRRVKVKFFNTTRDINWHPIPRDGRVQLPLVCRDLYLNHFTGWHLLSGEGKMAVKMPQLACLRRLTDRNLLSFLSFLEEYDVHPNSNWVPVALIGRWLGEAERSKHTDVLPVLENRSEYREQGVQTQGWQSIFLRIRLFDFLMARFDVRIRFKYWNGEEFFYFQGPDRLGVEQQSWTACENALQRTREPPWKRMRH